MTDIDKPGSSDGSTPVNQSDTSMKMPCACALSQHKGIKTLLAMYIKITSHISGTIAWPAQILAVTIVPIEIDQRF
jgi:hypothetical protein